MDEKLQGMLRNLFSDGVVGLVASKNMLIKSRGFGA